MSWKLRKATLDDKEKIEELFVKMLQSIYNTDNVSGYEVGDLDKFFRNQGDWICVAEDNGVVIAFLSIEFHYEEEKFIYLDDLSVLDSYRNLGIGTQLIRTAEQYARDVNFSTIVFHVEKSNESAFRLYRRLGYEIESEEGSRYRMIKNEMNRGRLRMAPYEVPYEGEKAIPEPKKKSDIFINTRSSIKIAGTKTIYFDPLDIEGTPHDADMVFLTHEHYDHYSPDDIKKILRKNTQIIVPVGMLDMVTENRFLTQILHGILPMQTENYDGVKCQGISAYNINKPYHPKINNWLGYLVEMDGKTYYAMGDTDVTTEATMVDADVVFVPIGGKYTMDATEAAAYINKKQPGLVVPIHYADSEVREHFNKLLKPEINVQWFW